MGEGMAFFGGVAVTTALHRSAVAALLLFGLAACNPSEEPQKETGTQEGVREMATKDGAASGKATLTGVVKSLGNGVKCAQIETEDGKLHSVDRLSAKYPVGTKVRVSGTYGFSIRCTGETLLLEEITPL